VVTDLSKEPVEPYLLAFLKGRFTQPLTAMNIGNIKIIMFLGSKVRRVLRVDNLTAICEPIV
jgi:hypothetical protein